MWRSFSFRIAALYIGVFALSVALLAGVALTTTRHALRTSMDARVHGEASALSLELNRDGPAALLQTVRERERSPGALEYGVQTADGRPIEGRLRTIRAPMGWSESLVAESQDDIDRMRIFATGPVKGVRLLVGDDLEPAARFDQLIVRRFASALAAVVLLAVAGGYVLSRQVHRRLSAISATAEAIIDGDLKRRVPTAGTGDDLDRLAHSLNRMLDRIDALMDSLRQVSNDIAHDLRTPLTRVRQRLEAAQADASTPAQAEAMEAAMQDLDSALDTFAALLRIAQIESGARRAAFRTIDLSEIAQTVVEAFAPSAQEAQRSLRLEGDAPVIVEGDRELLTLMLVNLVENGIRHTPPGSAIIVRCQRAASRAVMSVADNGAGVPVVERERLFDRFYRREQSRSTPGSGLGLAIVAAIAKLHGAAPEIRDAGPGLEARVEFASAEPGMAQP